MKTGPCPLCETLEARYLGASATLMGSNSFTDAEGKFHSHDPNQTNHAWQCKNGHYYKTIEKKHLCWCQKETVTDG